MPRYAPALSPLVTKALHFEGKRRGLPMTRLADACLTQVLNSTPGWKQAKAEVTGTIQPSNCHPADSGR